MPGAEITKEELFALENVQNIGEWKATVQEILTARNGLYPFNWLHEVKLSGLMNRVMKKLSQEDTIEYDISLD